MNRYRKKYQAINGEGKYSHYALYQMVRDLLRVVAKHREEHPRTKSWKDLHEIAIEIDLAQKHWSSESDHGGQAPS